MTAVKQVEQAVTIHEPHPAPVTPMTLLQSAVASGNLELAERLMNLADRWEATQARKAFDEAVANAKAEIPVIIKNATSHNNKYADFAGIAGVIDPVLSNHGIRYRFRSQQTEKSISVTCVLTHKGGHAEENTLTGPIDATIGKNALQAIGSTLTYLQRYSLVQALGLAASKDDDGKGAGGGGTLTDEQVKQIDDLIADVGADRAKFLKYFKADSISSIAPSRFRDAVHALEAKRAPL